MKVHQFLEILNRMNPEAEIIIHRDVENFGFGEIDKVKFGVFVETDYGNDFYPDTTLILRPSEVKAICLYALDCQKDGQFKSEH